MSEQPVTITDEEVAFARRIAAIFSRQWPSMRDEFESAAMLGLTEAANNYQAGGEAQFTTYARHAIEGRIRGALQLERPHGYRFSWRERNPDEDAPRVLSDSVGTGTGGDETFSLTSVIQADELPIGWDIEYQDEIKGLSRCLPDSQRAAFLAFYGRAGGGTIKETAETVGKSEAWVRESLAESALVLSGRFSSPDEIMMSGRPEHQRDGQAVDPGDGPESACDVDKKVEGPEPRELVSQHSPAVQVAQSLSDPQTVAERRHCTCHGHHSLSLELAGGDTLLIDPRKGQPFAVVVSWERYRSAFLGLETPTVDGPTPAPKPPAPPRARKPYRGTGRPNGRPPDVDPERDALFCDLFERHPDYSDARIRGLYFKETGIALSRNMVAYRRRALGFPASTSSVASDGPDELPSVFVGHKLSHDDRELLISLYCDYPGDTNLAITERFREITGRPLSRFNLAPFRAEAVRRGCDGAGAATKDERTSGP